MPSTNELAAFHRINPATAAKGVNLLVDEGLLDKRRGIGMFVAAGRGRCCRATPPQQFTERYVAPLLTEAGRLGIGPAAQLTLIARESGAHGEETLTPRLADRHRPPLRRPPGALADVTAAIGDPDGHRPAGPQRRGQDHADADLTGQDFATGGTVQVFGAAPGRERRGAAPR